jgi:hypothetical protein
MARHRSRSNKKMKRSRSRKQHGGVWPFDGLGEKIKALLGRKPGDPVAETDKPNEQLRQNGGGRKKTKKRNHRRHRK